MRKTVTAVTLALVVTTALTRAQPPTTDAALRQATEDLYRAALNSRSPLTPPTLLEDVNWLRDSVRRPAFWDNPVTRAADVSAAYLRSLQVAADLLLHSGDAQVLTDIADDLHLKVQHCRDLRIGMGGSVRLKVNTRRGDGNVRNLQVRYLLKFYETSAGAQPVTFPRLSSPTEAALEPGRYWVWAFDPATGRDSTRTLVRVAGRRQMEVDVPAP
jgi:hypothetical protein